MLLNAQALKTQIEAVLKSRYFPIILPIADAKWSDEQHEKNRISRSLAAFAIEKLADVSPAQAANSVVDGGEDNGLDAIYFDRIKNCLWIIQSKSGTAPNMGENKKFCDGIRDLQAARFARFGTNFARVQPDVEDALATEGGKIIGCHIYLGNDLATHAEADLNLLKDQLNEFTEIFEWKSLGLPAVHGWLTAEHATEPLKVTLTLERWSGVDQPHRAFYGLVSATQLANLYESAGKRLFERNIRHYLGDEAVNSAISTTVQDQPKELFFLNNGLTAICSQINPKPGAKSARGEFVLTGFSVVNGAQTVGSIAHTKNTVGEISPDAKLLITLIEVGEEPDNIGSRITRTRNTQNAVKGLHFAALDPQQERLRQELMVSGITYHYRPSAEATLGGPDVITIDQAVTALACFSGNTRTIVALKKEIGQLYDYTGIYYPTLFRESLSGVHLCRAVRVYNYLNGILHQSELAENQFFRRMFYRHGRYFILHIFARRHRSLLDKTEIEISTPDKLELSRLVTDLAEIIYTVATARFNYTKGYLSIFRNNTDAEPLATAVMQQLA